MNTIRVLRVIEYTGPKDKVEIELNKAIRGQRVVNGVTIKAATVEPFLGDPRLNNTPPGFGVDSTWWKPPGFEQDPVHQLSIDDGWCFWDETWAYKIGPYPTEAAARIGLAKYCKQLDGVTGAQAPKTTETTD